MNFRSSSLQKRLFRILTDFAFSILVFSAAGCGGSGEARYIPSEETGKDALTAALQAWQDGQPHGVVKSGEVPIDTYDARWQAGAKLERFEVVRSEMLDSHKAFIVKMKLVDEPEEQEDTYLVIGKDPLMVFRKQDYNKASGVGGGD